MPSIESSPPRSVAAPAAISLFLWYACAVLLVVLGLLLAARAGDEYMAVSGMLFAGFGVFLGFRLLRRAVP